MTFSVHLTQNFWRRCSAMSKQEDLRLSMSNEHSLHYFFKLNSRDNRKSNSTNKNNNSQYHHLLDNKLPSLAEIRWILSVEPVSFQLLLSTINNHSNISTPIPNRNKIKQKLFPTEIVNTSHQTLSGIQATSTITLFPLIHLWATAVGIQIII